MSEQVHPLIDSSTITYNGDRITWPTNAGHCGDDVAMACRVAGGRTTTNPGVWRRVHYSAGRFTGYIRPGVEVRHMVMAIKQSGTEAAVIGAEEAMRKFGLMPALVTA